MRLLVLLAASAALLGASAACAAESPSYNVIVDDGDFQVRDYAPILVAQTRVKSDASSASRTAFRRLFDYISGGNQGRREIAMTTPVRSQRNSTKIDMTTPVTTHTSDGEYVMQFVVPSQFDANTVPVPTSSLVEIATLPAERVAVLRYSGRSNQRNYRRAEAVLIGELERRGLRAIGAPRQAVYNGPFTPGFLRTNEVLVPLASG